MKLTSQSKFLLPLLAAASAFACGGSTGSDESDDDMATASGGEGGTPGGGGGGGEDSGSGGDGLGTGGDGGENGGGPNPDDKPDPVEDYPCYGDRREFAVDSTGQVAAEAHHVLRITYDEQGNELSWQEDDGNDGVFESTQYWTYDESGTNLTWGFDRGIDGQLNSRADFFYNDIGQLIGTDYYNPADELFSNSTVTYDEHEWRASVTVVLSDGTVSSEQNFEWLSAWEYNSFTIRDTELLEAAHVVLNEYGDFLLEELWLDENMTELISRTTTTYDDFGRPVTAEVDTDSGLSLTESSYAASGLIEKEEITEDAVLVAIAEYSYFEACLD